MMDKKNFNLNNPALAMVNRVQSQQAGLGVQSADVVKTKKVDPDEKGKPGNNAKQNVKEDVKQKDKQNDKQKTWSDGCYLHKQEKVSKGITMTIRTTEELKEEFDSVRHFYGYSQSDFLAALMVFAKEQAVKDGWRGTK